MFSVFGSVSPEGASAITATSFSRSDKGRAGSPQHKLLREDRLFLEASAFKRRGESDLPMKKSVQNELVCKFFNLFRPVSIPLHLLRGILQCIKRLHSQAGEQFCQYSYLAGGFRGNRELRSCTYHRIRVSLSVSELPTFVLRLFSHRFLCQPHCEKRVRGFA